MGLYKLYVFVKSHRSIDEKGPHLDLIERTVHPLEILDLSWLHRLDGLWVVSCGLPTWRSKCEQIFDDQMGDCGKDWVIVYPTLIFLGVQLDDIFLSSLMVRGNHCHWVLSNRPLLYVMYAVPGLAHNLLHNLPHLLLSFIYKLGLEDPAENSEGTVEPDGRRWNPLPTSTGQWHEWKINLYHVKPLRFSGWVLHKFATSPMEIDLEQLGHLSKVTQTPRAIAEM